MKAARPAPDRSCVAIVGVVRNCAKALRSEVRRLLAATSMFHRRSMLVIESDSSDDTCDVLSKISKDVPGFRFTSLGTLAPRFPKRTERIAFCRNTYLAELRERGAYSGLNYVIVADLDGVNSRLTGPALASCWTDRLGEWDVCTANQAAPYYDIWALRHRAWCPGDCWADARALTPALGERRAADVAVWSKMVRIAPTAPPILVESAFGGLAVYRADVLLQSNGYRGITATGNEVCEHVFLHESLTACGCRIFINPALINAGRTAHSAAQEMLPRMRRRVRALLRHSWHQRVQD